MRDKYGKNTAARRHFRSASSALAAARLLRFLFGASGSESDRFAVQTDLHAERLCVIRTLLADKLVGEHLPALTLHKLLAGRFYSR